MDKLVDYVAKMAFVAAVIIFMLWAVGLLAAGAYQDILSAWIPR